MAPLRAFFIIVSILSFIADSLAQTLVVISDSPITGTAAANPATTSIFGGTLIISQDDIQNTTLLTLDANLVAVVANANGNTTQIQEALGYGYHNALSKKFISIPVVAISAIIAYVSVLLAEDNHLISTNDGITALEPISLGLSTSDTNALAAADAPDPGFLVISRLGTPGLVTITMPAAAVETASGDVCPENLACDDAGCNAPAPSDFCPEGNKYAACECKLVYYNSNQIGGNVTALASGASVFDAMMAMSNAPTATPSPTFTGPVCSSTSSVYGCANPCCICPQGAGVVAPFLTATVSGTPTTNCAYTVQPTEDNCPAPPVTTPTPTSTHCTPSTDSAHTTWFACNRGGPYQVTSPGQVQGDATAPFNCKTPAIQGWTTTIPIAPGCMCATTYGPIPTTSIAQLTHGSSCNPSISSAAPLYSISSLESPGGTNDGLAIPYCVISGTKVPEVTQAFGQCYGHGSCDVGYYIANGGTGDPSCA